VTARRSGDSVPSAALPQAFDLIADMLANPRFDPDDLTREQGVIIEEMKMIGDTPDELLNELFHAAYFPGHSLGRPIEGTEQTVSSFDRAITAGFHSVAYSPRNLVVAAAGNVMHAQLVELAAQTFGDSGNAPDEISAVAFAPEIAAPILIERKNELEQAHLIIASPWPSARSEDRYAASMLGTVIGGGTSSRLWQSIREERGLAYSIGAGGNTYTDIGMFTIYAGTSPANLDQVLDCLAVRSEPVVCLERFTQCWSIVLDWEKRKGNAFTNFLRSSPHQSSRITLPIHQ